MTKLMAFLMMTFMTMMACEEVPGGWVGMIRTTSGFDGDVLSPGNHTCFGRDRIYLLEISDKQMKIPIEQLCRDNINFSVDIGILFSVDTANIKIMKDTFLSLTANAENRIDSKLLFETYVKTTVDEAARKVISKYQTSEMVANRVVIKTEISTSVKEAFKGSLIRIKQVTMNNDNFPKFVTDAQELKAKKIVEIETEKAEQEKRLISEQNLLVIQELKYKRTLLEAAGVADTNKIIGASITPGYLAWWQLKVLGEAASNNGNWGIIPYSDFSNKNIGTSNNTLVDTALLQRISQAKESSENKVVEKTK